MRCIVPAVFSVAVFPVILTAALAAALTTTTPDAATQSRTGQSQTITVTLVNRHPPGLRWVKHLQESFVPAVEQALAGTGIALRWKQQYGGTLAKVGEELEAIQDGIADVALVPIIFEPSKLPLQNISYYTPFVSTDPGLITGAVQAVQEAVQARLPAMLKAWEDSDVLYIGGGFALDDYYLFTKFPVNSLDDLKGRKLATPELMLACSDKIAPWCASVAFGGPDLHTVYVGSLRGERLPYFRSPVAGLALAHWQDTHA